MPNLFRHPTSKVHYFSRGILKQVQDDKSLQFNHQPNIMDNKQGHVYIMSNQYRTTFYIGVTSDLETRVWQYSNGEGSVFTKKYRCYDLIYYEHFPSILDAIDREKQLKNWHRPWKIALIESINPKMKDLKVEIKSCLYAIVILNLFQDPS